MTIAGSVQCNPQESAKLFVLFARKAYDIRDAYMSMFHSLTDNPDPVCVLLTDGKYGSAFFEHRYLSDLLGIPLVEGRNCTSAMTGGCMPGR